MVAASSTSPAASSAASASALLLDDLVHGAKASGHYGVVAELEVTTEP